MKYHPYCIKILIRKETVPVGQFNWGGFLLKGNGGAQRYPHAGWKSAVECKGISLPDCEADRPSRRESGA